MIALRLPAMAPHVLKHLGALARLGAEDATLAAGQARRAGVRFAVAACTGFFALLMGCALVLAIFWDTPYRVVAAAVLAGTFLIVAIVAALAGRRALAAHEPFAATRRNVDLDRRLYAELRPPEPATAGAPPAPPERQLEESRAEIRRIARSRNPIAEVRDRVVARETAAASAGTSAAPARGRRRLDGARLDSGFPRSRTMQLITRRSAARELR